MVIGDLEVTMPAIWTWIVERTSNNAVLRLIPFIYLLYHPEKEWIIEWSILFMCKWWAGSHMLPVNNFFFLSSINIAMSILCRAPASTLNPSWLFIALHLFSVNFYPCFCFKTWREDCCRVMLEIMHSRYDFIIQESHYIGHRSLILWNTKNRAIKTVLNMKTCFRNWNHQKHTHVSLCVPNESEIRMLSEMKLQ